jgi:hypothetical protein
LTNGCPGDPTESLCSLAVIRDLSASVLARARRLRRCEIFSLRVRRRRISGRRLGADIGCAPGNFSCRSRIASRKRSPSPPRQSFTLNQSCRSSNDSQRPNRHKITRYSVFEKAVVTLVFVAAGPVSRILSAPASRDGTAIPLGRASLRGSSDLPEGLTHRAGTSPPPLPAVSHEQPENGFPKAPYTSLTAHSS